MKNIFNHIFTASFIVLAAACGHKEASLQINVPEKYEGETVELIDYLDSTTLASSVITDGKAILVSPENQPAFTAVVIDGKIRAFYINEPGNAQLNDSVNSAYGTKLNDRFGILLNRLDSVEQSDDMELYLDFVEKSYNENKDNPIGEYFGLEWVKYADLPRLDSMLAVAPEKLKNSRKTKRYVNFARLRAKTDPGMPFVDFEGEDEDGKPLPLSAFVKPGEYLLVDFWASWCPYCIKELPAIKSLNEKWGGKGLNIVGVAVRDLPEDTKASVAKHAIEWPVIYNTQRKPYDIYGFSGIPHHILIGPDGKIVSRGESIEQIDEKLKQNLESQQEK